MKINYKQKQEPETWFVYQILGCYMVRSDPQQYTNCRRTQALLGFWQAYRT